MNTKRQVPSLLVVIVFALLVSLCLTSVSSANSKQLPVDRVDMFFKQLMAGKVSDAYDNLFTGSSIPKNKPQAVAFIKQQTSSGLSFYGKLIDWELLRKEQFGKSLVRFVCILRSEMAPTIWEFFFYKPKDTWFLVHVIFNDKFNLLNAKNP